MKENKVSKIEKIVYEMLLENTGVSGGDSGGYPKYDESGRYIGSEQGYGRMYERYRNKPIEEFINEPSLQFNITSWGVETTISLFHHIVNNCEVDAKCLAFNKLKMPYWESLDDDIPKYNKWLDKWCDENGLITRRYNTYNGDSDLNQGYLYFFLQGGKEWYDGDNYIAIASMNGCDYRGGYTNFRLFKLNDEYYPDVYYKKYRIEEDLKYGYGTWYLDGEELSEAQLNLVNVLYKKTLSFEKVYKLMKLEEVKDSDDEEERKQYTEAMELLEKEMMDKNPNQLKLYVV